MWPTLAVLGIGCFALGVSVRDLPRLLDPRRASKKAASEAFDRLSAAADGLARTVDAWADVVAQTSEAFEPLHSIESTCGSTALLDRRGEPITSVPQLAKVLDFEAARQRKHRS